MSWRRSGDYDLLETGHFEVEGYGDDASRHSGARGFSAEMERTLQVLDYAILVISGTDGVQEHTRTLWRLLARYRVPTFLFINKMDLAGLGKGAILDDLRKILKETFVDFGEAGTDHFTSRLP